MKDARYRRAKSALLTGWVLWAPILAMPFGALFCETWLQTQIIANDYELNELVRAEQVAEGEIGELRTDVASLEAIGRMNAKASDLGLVEPEHHQIHIIYSDRAHETRVFADRFDMARLDTQLSKDWLDGSR